MEDCLDSLKYILLVALVILTLICGVQAANIAFFDNVPTEVYVDQKLVYQGPSGGVSVDSSGANTTVSVKGGLLYMFPKAYYVSKDVKLVGVK